MADLWALTVAFRHINTSIRLVYNNEKDARSGYAALLRPKVDQASVDRGLESPYPDRPEEVEIVDNYGSTLCISPADVMAHWLTDLGAESESQVDAQQLQAHSQAKLQRRLAADPMLKGVVQMQPPPGFKLS